jgi:protein-disulfide isomerase
VGADDKYTSIGPKNAPITIVKFSDFQCPSCKFGAFALHPILLRYPEKIRLVIRNFPLDPTCNREVPQGGHAHACEAAKIAVCANQQGKFKAVYEQFFEHQDEIAAGRVHGLAAGLGLDMAKIDECVTKPETMGAIKADIEEGIKLGVSSTPTFFFNGKKIEGGMPSEVWQKLLEQN